LQARLEHIRVEHLTGLQSNGRLLAMPTHIRLGWKLIAVANTLAYYDIAAFQIVKSSIIQDSLPNLSHILD
jgi:hypothetical protein